MIGLYRDKLERMAMMNGIPIDPAVMAIWRVKAFDLTVLANAALVPTAGYSVGTIQYVDSKLTLATGVIKAVVSNDPACDAVVAHPTATTLSAAGATAGVALEHAWFGAQVTTIQGSAADNTVQGELWIVLKR
jgi:hypothetical protein